MHIGIDIDNVIVRTILLMAQVLGEYLGIKITEGDVVLRFNLLKDAEKFIYQNQEKIYYSSDPIKGAVETINYFHKHHTVSIVTARNKNTYFDTINWLNKYGIKYDNIFFTSRQSKIQICRMHNIDIFIEDSNTNALEITEIGIPVILLTQEYNYTLNGELITHCKDWNEIRNAINLLSKY